MSLVRLHVLAARAMLQLKKGQIDEAWQDLLAVHGLAHRVAQGEISRRVVMGYGIKREACTAERAILQNAELGPKQIESMRDDLDKLPQFPGIVDKLNLGDRITCLDSVYSLAPEISGRMAVGNQSDPTLQKVLRYVAG